MTIPNSMTPAVFTQHFVFLRQSLSSGWPQTHHVAEDDPDVLGLPPQPLCGTYWGLNLGLHICFVKYSAI